VLVPNGHLERGEPLATWLPELPIDYSYPLAIPASARASATRLAKAGQVLLYLSGIGPNRGFHANTWQPSDWVIVIELLNAVGITPLLIGAATQDDRSYRDLVVSLAGGRARWQDIVGQTSIPEICAIIEHAAVWIGLNSGTGIVSAMLGTPTVMLWSDSRYPIPGAIEPLHVAMQRSWLTQAQLERYRTLSYGSPELTPARVVIEALEVMRR
jgi:ADP-heptose:LPS heptosyltransferase